MEERDGKYVVYFGWSTEHIRESRGKYFSKAVLSQILKGLTFQVKEFGFCYTGNEESLKAAGTAECYDESYPLSSNDLLQEFSGGGGGKSESVLLI